MSQQTTTVCYPKGAPVSAGRKKAAPRATHQPAPQPAPGVPGAGSNQLSKRGKGDVKRANARARDGGAPIVSARVVQARIAAARAARADG